MATSISFHPSIPVFSPSFLYRPYIPSFKSKDLLVTLNFSTELEHALKIVTARSVKQRSVHTEYKSASKTVHCNVSLTKGFDGVRWLNQILLSQTFLKTVVSWRTARERFSIIMYGDTPTRCSMKVRHVIMSHLL